MCIAVVQRTTQSLIYHSRKHCTLSKLPSGSKVCALGNGICSGSDGDEWVDLLAEIKDGGIKSFTSTSTAGVDGEKSSRGAYGWGRWESSDPFTDDRTTYFRSYKF